MGTGQPSWSSTPTTNVSSSLLAIQTKLLLQLYRYWMAHDNSQDTPYSWSIPYMILHEDQELVQCSPTRMKATLFLLHPRYDKQTIRPLQYPSWEGPWSPFSWKHTLSLKRQTTQHWSDTAAWNQTTRTIAPNCCSIHKLPNPYSPSCGWWFHRRADPYSFFELSPVRPQGLRPGHQVLTL